MRKTMSFLFGITKKYKYKQLIGLLLTVLYSVSTFITPMISQYLIDNLVDNKSLSFAMEKILLFGAILLSTPIITFFRDRLFNKLNTEIKFDLQSQTFNKLFDFSLDFYEQNSKGEILARLTNDVSQIGNFVSDFTVEFIKNLTMVIGVLVGMIYYSPVITTITISIMIFGIGISNLFNSKVRAKSKLSQECYDKICNIITNVIYNVQVVKVFSCKLFFSKKYDRIITKYKETNAELYNVKVLVSTVIEFTSVLCLAVIYVVGFALVYNEKMTIGYVIALSIYFQMLGHPLLSLISSNYEFQKIVPIANRVQIFLQSEIKNNVFKEKLLLNDTDSLEVEIEDLSFSYNNSDSIFKDLNLIMKGRSINTITGESGSGKSTLLSLILGLRIPNTGSVRFSSISLSKVDISNEVLLVPQETQLFNVSILDNIICGAEGVSIERIHEICKKVGIYDYIAGLEKEFSTVVTEDINLSGGQAQRICIARALVRQPHYLIFDEPTSALDSMNSQNIMELFHILKKECTIIVVTHNDMIIDQSDYVIDLANIIS